MTDTEFLADLTFRAETKRMVWLNKEEQRRLQILISSNRKARRSHTAVQLKSQDLLKHVRAAEDQIAKRVAEKLDPKPVMTRDEAMTIWRENFYTNFSGTCRKP
jgi:hypothetical protein